MKLRKPANLPLDEDIRTIRNFALKKISEIVSTYVLDAHSFIELRDVICARLTLFNGRRGGEPARLLIRELQEGLNEDWVEKNKLDPLEQKLSCQLKITYQSGKGNLALVPLIIPDDTIEGLKILIDLEIRSQVGVNVENKYVFPCTQNSPNHICGTHAISMLCEKTRVQQRSTLILIC